MMIRIGTMLVNTDHVIYVDEMRSDFDGVHRTYLVMTNGANLSVGNMSVAEVHDLLAPLPRGGPAIYGWSAPGYFGDMFDDPS